MDIVASLLYTLFVPWMVVTSLSSFPRFGLSMQRKPWYSKSVPVFLACSFAEWVSLLSQRQDEHKRLESVDGHVQTFVPFASQQLLETMGETGQQQRYLACSRMQVRQG